MLRNPDHMNAAKDDLTRITSEMNELSQKLAVLRQRKRSIERDISGYKGEPVEPVQTVPEPVKEPETVPELPETEDLDESEE